MNTALRAVGLALLFLLAGCSTPPPQDDGVASLETTGSAPPATSNSSVDAGRPRERLDMTQDEVVEMDENYNRCLADNGYDSSKEKQAAAEGPQSADAEARFAAAEAACLGEKPLPPWEYDTANPESSDFVHAVVQCLRDKGIRYVEEAPLNPGDDRRGVSLGGENNDRDSITRGMSLIPTCEKEMAR